MGRNSFERESTDAASASDYVAPLVESLSGGNLTVSMPAATVSSDGHMSPAHVVKVDGIRSQISSLESRINAWVERPTLGPELTGNALFYGGIANSTPSNAVSLLSPTAILVQAESNIGTARGYLAGADVDMNALFYGGGSRVTLLSPTGTLVQAESDIGSTRNNLSGTNVGINALFYGGSYQGNMVNLAVLLSPTGTSAQTDSNVGTPRSNLAGSNVGLNALFYGGSYLDGSDASVIDNITTILSPTATLVQAEGNVGTTRSNLAGANVGTNALFYGGVDRNSISNAITVITPTATLLQAESNVGTTRFSLAGANVGANALFSGGTGPGYVVLNTTTILSPTGVLVQPETNVGIIRSSMAGASV